MWKWTKFWSLDVSMSILTGNMDGYTLPIPRRSVIRLDDLVANDVQHAIGPVKSRRIIITFRQQVALC